MGLLSALWGKRVAQIEPEEASRRLREDKRVVIVDVRQPVETRGGSVPGAVLIPLTEFGRRLDELPRDRPILTICRSGHRSPLAARQLKRAGYDVTDVAGGTMAWERAGLPIVAPEQ
ncbi:MAG: rhodanese-like domain-containing protein [Candidatus Promineofilum sp.]|jgi:rhodanese-related sulfurtransferase|nr:rhodanese-like domain-containing protein [Promineifilum sp.]